MSKPNRVSVDEIISVRRLSAGDDGTLFKAVILSDVPDMETKGYDAASRSQRFVMSSETKDLYGDIVRQSGIDITNFAKNPVGLAYHDGRSPIGWWSDVKSVNGRPKRTEGTLTLHPEGTTDRIDEIGRLLAASAIKACSIGFMPLEAEWIMDENGRNTYGLDFTASSLLECSVCAIPANPDALAKSAGGNPSMAAELFELVLDTYCERTASGLFVRKEYEDTYMGMKARKTISVPEPAPKAPVVVVEDATGDDIGADRVVKDYQKEVGGLVSRFVDGITALFGSAAAPTAPAEIVDKAIDAPAEDPVVPPIEEIQEPSPALVKGSRAKANAETARLRASILLMGSRT